MIRKGLSSSVGGTFTDEVVLDVTFTFLGFSFFLIILQFPEKFGTFDSLADLSLLRSPVTLSNPVQTPLRTSDSCSFPVGQWFNLGVWSPLGRLPSGVALVQWGPIWGCTSPLGSNTHRLKGTLKRLETLQVPLPGICKGTFMKPVSGLNVD